VRKYFPLISICCLLALVGCERKGNEEANKPTPAASPQTQSGVIVIPPDSLKLTQIRVEPVKTAEVTAEEVVTPGKVVTNPNRISRVTLPVVGRVTQVLAKLGDSVRAGQVLLAIDSPDADAAVATYRQSVGALNQTNASLAQAKSAAIKAQTDYDRAADLFEHNAVAQKEVLNARSALEQAKAGVDAANAGVESAKAAREQARERLKLLGLKENEAKRQVTVRAPLTGKVLDISVVAGEYRNDTTAPVMTIADLGTVWIASDIPENSVRLIHVGEAVEITLDAYPGETFRGRVARLADTLDPKARTLQAMIELNNSSGRFRPEMFGSVRLAQSSREMPVLPVGAVIQEGGRNVVYVEQSKGRFEQREVVTGNRVGDVVAIVRGVSAGERVVVDGVMLLGS
jgi:membrane fusion protein, heavy metal efflux system